MSADPKILKVLEDLLAIRHWCTDRNQDPPKSAVEYLAANKDLLLCYIARLVSTQSAERRKVFSQHRELDESVIADDCSFARNALDQAYEAVNGNKLADVEADDVNMVLRPIEYLKYLNDNHCPYSLCLSPVQLPS